MRYRRIRQHVREFFTRDWVEFSANAFGVLALVAGVFFAFVVVYLILNYNDDQWMHKLSPSSRKVLSIVGMVIFASLASVSLIGGWNLVGKRMARAVTGRRHQA